MKRITEITICNYRAFYNEEGHENKYQINLKNGENLLVYGENGSGKSSLFKAIEDFFHSSNEIIAIQENVFTTGQLRLPPAEVKIKFSEKTLQSINWNLLEEIKFNIDAPTTSENILLKEASLAFLSYKDILKTYFLDFDNTENSPNLFDLFIDILLSKIIDPSTNISIRENLIKIIKSIETLEEAIIQTMKQNDDDDPEKKILEKKSKEQVKEDILGQIRIKIEDFNTSLTAILNAAIDDVNYYLNEFFNSNIEVLIRNENEYLTLEEEGEKIILNKGLYFYLKYFDKNLEDQQYHVFLNEARLSALAICIYLAAVKRDKPTADNIKILFLDDIFIGLDTSNRIPLLEILKRDFNNHQIFITTYDRNWFEVAKDYLENWINIEIYVGRKDGLNFEFPVIIDKDLNFKDKATKYFESFDYFSSANNIRKAIEKQIEKLVPDTYLITEKDLDGNFRQLIYYYNECDCGNLISDSLQKSLFTFKDIVLNPSSHYDFKCPIYKVEVEKAFNVLDLLYQLPLLKRTLLMKIGDSLYYKNQSANYESHYILAENIYSVLIISGEKRITVPNHKLVFWSLNGISFSDNKGSVYPEDKILAIKNQISKLSERPKKIEHFLGLSNLPDWLSIFKNSEGKSISDLQEELLLRQ